MGTNPRHSYSAIFEADLAKDTYAEQFSPMPLAWPLPTFTKCTALIPSRSASPAQSSVTALGIRDGVLALRQLADFLLQLSAPEPLAADERAQHGQPDQAIGSMAFIGVHLSWWRC